MAGRHRYYQGIEGVCTICRLVQPFPVLKDGLLFARCRACGGRLADRPAWKVSGAPLPITDIPYPGEDSELEIQAYLVVELRKLGYDARLEVGVRNRADRFDIVVFRDRRAVRIIEVKRRRTAGATVTATESVAWHKAPTTEAKLNRYRAYGIPVDLVQGRAGAEKYLEAVARWRGAA